jgi:SAM-dependent methyltransferase
MATAAAHVWGTAPEFVGPRHELRERLLLALLLRAKPGPSVLNAGAGQGTFTQLLEQRGFEVTSMDLSPPAVEVLRERVQGPVALGNLLDVPFDDESFDVVVLGEVLEHIARDDEALKEAARVLRPGGVVAISVPAASVPFGPSDHWAGHVRRYSSDRLLDTCRAAGLQVEALRAWGFPASALYHRHVYEPRLVRRGEAGATQAPRFACAALRMILRVDRLFVGVRRGALGYLLLARRYAD